MATIIREGWDLTTRPGTHSLHITDPSRGGSLCSSSPTYPIEGAIVTTEEPFLCPICLQAAQLIGAAYTEGSDLIELAFDVTTLKVACPLLQPIYGGISPPPLAFPPETWEINPTSTIALLKLNKKQFACLARAASLRAAGTEKKLALTTALDEARADLLDENGRLTLPPIEEQELRKTHDRKIR